MPLLDDDDNDDDNREGDSIDVRNDIDDQAILDMPFVVATGTAEVVENDRGGPTSTTNAQRLRKFCLDNNGNTSLPTYFPWTQGSGSESQKVGKICGISMRRKEVGKKQLVIVRSLLLWVKF